MDEQIKQPLMIGAIAGCSTVMLYELVYYFTLERGSPATFSGVLLGLLIGLVVGGIAGGITFAVTRNR